MKKYVEQKFIGERALFQSCGLDISHCTFADGESPLKESSNLEIKNTLFQWKYPLWYCHNVNVEDSVMFEMARSGIWYTNNNCTIESEQGMCYMDNVVMKNCKLLNTNLAFEYSTVEAVIDSNITSVKNSYSGKIKAKHIEEVIFDNPKMKKEDTEIITSNGEIVQAI